ncbi:carbon-nitrogen hydrolase family protein [Gymnodinialimonas sp. 2305UL16-5]|uniref:carbon-nitrogen hydrolase family protein n=1 Tax=Gymnodinialimonas mytili TaxID=3126503 RepID=UPI00309F7B8A
MADPLRLAIGQMCSADTHGPNIATVAELAKRAAGEGADMLALPEVAGLLNGNRKATDALVGEAADDPYIVACREQAAKHGLWIHSGSTPVRAPDGRFWNHSNLIDDQGAIRADYNKIHLFDVEIEGKVSFTESKAFAPGDRAVVVSTPWGKIGLTICYDLRFPALYRALAEAGAEVIFTPAAFTVPTGEAHWHILLRARAIETGSFVVAPAQAGHHADGRTTYGHALAINPWGDVIADLGSAAPAIQVVDLDLREVARMRAQIPSLDHARPFTVTHS